MKAAPGGVEFGAGGSVFWSKKGAAAADAGVPGPGDGADNVNTAAVIGASSARER